MRVRDYTPADRARIAQNRTRLSVGSPAASARPRMPNASTLAGGLRKTPTPTVRITTPDAPDEPTLEKEIIDRCAGQLAAFKVPRAVYVVDEFPTGTLDKILKNRLRDMADERPAID